VHRWGSRSPQLPRSLGITAQPKVLQWQGSGHRLPSTPTAMLTAAGSAEAPHPEMPISPGKYPHRSPGAGPPGFPTGTALAKHQPH